MSNPYRFQPADHIKVSRGLYSHHGIYVGDGLVVHWVKTKGLRPRILETKLAKFEGSKTATLVNRASLDERKSIIARARSSIGKTGYSVIWNNCEHFATWCRSGESQSGQVQTAAFWGTMAFSAGVLALWLAPWKNNRNA